MNNEKLTEREKKDQARLDLWHHEVVEMFHSLGPDVTKGEAFSCFYPPWKTSDAYIRDCLMMQGDEVAMKILMFTAMTERAIGANMNTSIERLLRMVYALGYRKGEEDARRPSFDPTSKKDS